MDRHVAAGRGDRVAFHWEGEPGDTRTITYADLLRDVCVFANALEARGIQKGDRVTLYMGMVPELVVAMLACARIGAPHSIVFGGFSPDSLRERIADSDSKLVITQDALWRRGKPLALKPNVDAAIAAADADGGSPVQQVIVLERIGAACPIEMQDGRDAWWSDVVSGQAETHEAAAMDSEDLLYILYTSGTTGKPKGIAHTSAGYLLGASTTFRQVFDIKDDDIYWCTADIGWVTGHSYIVYGPARERSRPRSCTRARRTFPRAIASGRSSRSTA